MPIDLNQTNLQTGWNIFHYAAFLNRTEMLKWVLATGAGIDLNLKNFDNKTPLDLAIQYSNSDVQHLLESFLQDPEKVQRQLRKEFSLGGFFFFFYFSFTSSSSSSSFSLFSFFLSLLLKYFLKYRDRFDLGKHLVTKRKNF